MDKIISFLKKHDQLVVFFTAVLISVISLIYYYQKGLILAYGDAESHINIAKRVVSSITPGLGQLGGNWLPLQHMLMTPFVKNDFLWRSGLGGSFISMLSFIFSVLLIYKLVKLLTNNLIYSWIAVLIFVTNPSIIYMQSTPMGELPLIVMLIGGAYYITKWSTDMNFVNLIYAAIFSLCGTLIRYDAWFLVFFQVLIIIIIGIKNKLPYKKIEGKIIIFLSLALTGILMWIIWNILIFNDPMYFLTSPYSAKSQQLAWLARGELPSYKNIISSLSFYTVSTYENVGLIYFILVSLFFPFLVFFGLTKFKKSNEILSSLLLTVPYPFYVITLYFGISIILVPQLLPATFKYNMFNIRYGLMMEASIAVLCALFFSYFKKFGYLFFIIVFSTQAYLFHIQGTPPVIKDTTVGLSSRRPGPANNFVAKNYDYGFIMFDDFSRAANPVELNIPMEKIIYVGNHPYWEESLEHPTKYIRWFIIRKDDNDVIWNKLKNNREFLKNYYGVYNNAKTYVYKRK